MDKEVKVNIIGLGYVGLPLALQAASRGFSVTGVDKNIQRLVDLRNRKNPLITDLFVKRLVASTSLEYSDSVSPADIHIICVPTPIVRMSLPDLKFVESAAAEVSQVLRDGDLIIVESTVYPGVCEERVWPILARSGVEFGLAHCPERINPGDSHWNVANIPRVLGASSENALEKAVAFYTATIDAEIVTVSQLKAAEATKILENTFRDVNIAFINEMAKSFYLLGIDISEVIKGASTKPFGFLPHYPGAGVGGHCIAVDPYYMIEKGKEVGFNHEFLSLARQINSNMPSFTIRLVIEGLNRVAKSVNGSTIVVLGMAYKPDVADARESPSFEIVKQLQQLNAKVVRIDRYLPEFSDAESLSAIKEKVDCVILATAHREFLRDISVFAEIPVIIDGRNALPKKTLKEMGCVYLGIGIGAE